jgi:hypothetical protein
MLRHPESSASLGRYDPVWIDAHERQISQRRLRSNHEGDGAPGWLGTFFVKTRATREEDEASA